MEFLNNLELGFSVAFSLQNILFCFAGVLLGTLVGVLPGIGPAGAISILLPYSFYFGDGATSLIFLAGIFYGTQYGGSTTSILLNIPGEASSIATTIDGHALAKKGKAGVAISISAIGSFIAGTFATLLIALLAVPLSWLSVKFGPVEFTSLILFGFISSAYLTSNDDPINSISMILLGILIATIGVDLNSGIERYTFGFDELYDGIPFPIIAISLFGLSEIIYDFLKNRYEYKDCKIEKLYPSKEEFKESVPAIFRGTLLGSVFGILPGIGSSLSAFITYSIEKRISNKNNTFGNGDIRGVAAPESANNAASQTGFIPLLGLGLPGSPVMALMAGALMIQGIVPGPTVINEYPNIFWGLIVSMWLGNIALLILNLPMVKLWVSILKIPRYYMYSVVVILAVVGSFFMKNNIFFVLLLIPLTILGVLLRLLGYNVILIALGFVMGRIFEENFIRATVVSKGDWSMFLTSGISLTLLILSCIIILISRKKKQWKI